MIAGYTKNGQVGVELYVKSGRVGYARRVFDFMMEKDVVCSTSMISGYMREGCVEDAEEGITFEVGQQVQGQLMKTEFASNIKMESALVDMYAKCGRIEDARAVFNGMKVKNVFSWTSMIDGYGKNDDPNEALALFGRMQNMYHVRPNHVTFLGALSACGHAGLVSKGQEIFEIMEKDYSMKPHMEHYACMVDLLGRAGRLNEGFSFVMSMPEKPNSDVWAALLSSCRLHGDVEMASIAANELFKLSRDSRPGAYVALSNALADARRWDLYALFLIIK
ncbi:pentatricopeptide repeat-containing protein [Tanacetum coccineum]